MKKSFLMLLLVCFTTSAAFAQTKMWVGGTLSVASSDNGTSESAATFMPQFGVHLNENWSLGGSLGFSSSKTEAGGIESKSNVTSIVPFARYWISQPGTFRFFGQGELPLRFYGGEVDGNDLDSYNSVGLVLRPGVGISLSERWGLTMLMPPVFSFVNTDGNSDFYLGINDGYNIQDYILDTSLGIIFKF